MFDLPLHPLVVHFPIVLGILVPIAGLIQWWGIRKGLLPKEVWFITTGLAFLYFASALVTVELGEKDEKVVEKIISEKVIHEHEEAGELVPWISGTLFLLSLGGLFVKDPDKVRMFVGIMGIFAIVPLAQAGHTGGKLVYKYGAAYAHLPKEVKALQPIVLSIEKHESHEKD